MLLHEITVREPARKESYKNHEDVYQGNITLSGGVGEVMRSDLSFEKIILTSLLK